MNLMKLICAPVLLAVAVVDDAMTLVPRRMSDPDAESASMKAARFICEEGK